MTQNTNIVWLAEVRRLKDPAVAAWLKVRASGEDDVAYEFAIDMFERAVPTTNLGLWLKLRLIRQRERALMGGDVLTDEGRLHDDRYRMTLQARVV